MSLQHTETIELGDIQITDKPAAIYAVSHIGTSVVVILYDSESKVTGIAHVVLPDSSLGGGMSAEIDGKYADLAIPSLVEAYLETGGQLASTVVYMVGGAQLFNFGGGSGNILNIGARNATAIRTALSRQGLAVEKTDIGGNKAKGISFTAASGQCLVRVIGGAEYAL